MSLPIDSCDGNDSRNPSNNKYGGHYVTNYGMVVNVTPLQSPPVFPPNEISRGLNKVFQPSCTVDDAASVADSTIKNAIKQYCVDGNALGSQNSVKDGSGYATKNSYVHVKGVALTTDQADSAYQQGSTVCR